MKMKLVILLLALVLTTTSVMAAGEITQDADRLNYWNSQSHIITVGNAGSLTTNASITSSWTVTATDGVYCTEPITDEVHCILAPGDTGTYTVTSDASVGEYATQAFTLTTNNSDTSETATFVRMQDEEIFNTLVEYGRGRGNYFYDSGTMRTKGSQCTDLPSGTDIQLNYLHKIVPVINQYLNLPSAEGSNLTLYCTYPNETVIKSHLAANTAISGLERQVNYSSTWLKTSWEKVFFLVQNFDSGDYNINDKISVNCSDMSYYLEDANGYVKISNNSFSLTFQNASPLTVTATSSPTTIGTGQSEVEITYVITNTEDITLSSSSNPLTIDIEAPLEAKFIGTKGELWGTSLDIYHYEINSMAANEVLNITLVARFDTDAPATPALSQGVSVSFVPCWQVNAYNPLTTEQTLAVTETITVDASAASIRSIPDQLDDIETNITLMLSYLGNLTTVSSQINSTVNDIETLAIAINTTVVDNNAIITQVNNTVNTINTIVAAINDTVLVNQEYLGDINLTVNDTNNYLKTVVNEYLSTINATTDETNIIVKQINTTANSIELIVTDTNATVYRVETIVTSINGTVNTIETVVNQINSTSNTINNIVQYINTTIWGNLTAQDLLNNITAINTSGIQDYTSRFDNIDNNLTQLATDLRELEEFEEESIYLITDSITEGQTAYREAIRALDNGNEDLALKKLQESVDSLTEADRLIQDIQEDGTLTEAEKKGLIAKVVDWMLAIFR